LLWNSFRVKFVTVLLQAEEDKGKEELRKKESGG
jgi:hypothetical protein